MKFFATVLGAVALSVSGAMAETAQARYDVVPLPLSVEAVKGAPFLLTPDVKILYPAADEAMERNAGFLAGYVADNLGFTPAIEAYNPAGKQKKGGAPAIRLGLDSKVENSEGYRLAVSDKGVELAGSTPAGVFYGVQTLRKAIPVMPRDSVAAAVELPAAVVADEPRFHYRGMLLDCGRYFLPMDAVKQFIDLMVMHNMNTFHWHLTDDQGWRLELKRHPEITEKGSMRKETICGRVAPVYDGKPHGGFYSQDDVKEILKYAADRHITVIPEIDMPGHMVSLLASHPEVGCLGADAPYQVSTHFGPHIDILCAGKEETFALVEDILDEVCELFPSEYINIGGDEAWKQRWEQCPDCQARIKELGLKGDERASAEHKLQGYFTKRVEKMLNERGRKAIGWEEIFDAGVNQSTTILAWHGGFKYIVDGANAGHDVIAGSSEFNYLDYYQRLNKDEEPFLIGKYLPLSKTYRYEPMDERVLPENRHHIIGVQGCVWGEFIDNANLMTYQMLPRMAAVSESQWIQPEQKLYHKFLPRLQRLTPLYDRYSYPWCRSWE